MHALIVEDESGLRLIYRRVLEEMGFAVLEAADGTRAMELLEEFTPEIIFLDMLLPGVSGVTILNHITTTPRLRSTRTVIVSSNSQFAAMTNPDHAVEFVLKPIRPAQIREIASLVL